MFVFVQDEGAERIGDYIRRARQERALAASANTTPVAYAHLKLAQYYEALVARANDDEMCATEDEYASFNAIARGRRGFAHDTRAIL